MFRAFALLTLAACGTDGLFGQPDGPGESDPEPDTGPPPAVRILTPADGQGFYGAELPIEFEVSDFVLDLEGLDGANVAGHGHAHVYVDGEPKGEATAGLFTVDGVAEGTHTLEVRLAENDHTELDASAERAFPVVHPVLAIDTPNDGALLTSSNTPLTFRVADFTVAAARGEPDVFGEGHVVVTADGSFRDYALDPMLPVEVTGLSPGAHTLAVELVDNAGAPLRPPVRAEVTVTVPDLAPGIYFDRSVAAEPWDSAVLPLGIATTNFVLAAPDGTGLPIAGTGYWHLFMDGVWVDGAATPERLMENMTAGEHVFDVILTGNDLIELPVRDRMWVTIPADRPNVAVSYPGRDWAMGPAFEVAFSAENFTLDAGAMGGANATHVGHAQVTLDGVPLGETASGTWPVSGLLPGSHTLRVELVNNDGTPLDPPVYTEFPFTVT